MGDDISHDPTTRALRDFVARVSDAVVIPPFAPPGPGAPPRRRGVASRRGLAVMVSAVVVVGVLVAVIVYGPRSGDTTGGVTGTPPPTTVPTPVGIRTVPLDKNLHPAEIVGAAGALWVTGTGPNPSIGRCRVARVDPGRLSTTTFSLTACGMNVAASASALYLETETSGPDNAYLIRIERFSLSDHTPTVLAPVVMTVVGSEIAHTQLAYADGFLWLYGESGGAEVVQISPSTGKVVRTITDVPPIGGTEPLIAAGPDGIWLAGGAGGSARVEVISPTSTSAPVSTVPVGPASATVEWLSPVDSAGACCGKADQMWVGEVVLGTSHLPSGQSGRIVALDGTGTHPVVGRSPVEDFGSAPTAVGNQMWTVGPGLGGCGSQPVWRVDRRTLRTTPVISLPTASDPCLNGTDRSVSSVGGAAFVLDGTGGSQAGILYRVRP